MQASELIACLKYKQVLPADFADFVVSELTQDTRKVVPGAVFDREGYRIGYGGGYYDRYLAARREIPFDTLALAYPFQLVEEIPRDDWDLPVGKVLTPWDI